MKRLLIGVIVTVVAGFTFGGYAVVSVAKIPDGWVTNKPLQLSWQTRQHGITALYGLKPTLEARSGSRAVEGTTWEFNENGTRGYRGSITFPGTGDWQVTIVSGFMRSKAVLVPFKVVDSQKDVPVLSEAERGRRLFASQGCVTCHTHRDVGIIGELSTYGPDLSERQFPATYLAQFLNNPSIKPPTSGEQMPNLYLKDKDIAPLIAFINANRAVSAAR